MKPISRNTAGDYSDPGWYRHPPGAVAWKLADGSAAMPDEPAGNTGLSR
jgi:hypothetical protein